MDLSALDNVLPTLRNRGWLVLAVRATRSTALDLSDPYSTPWGEDRSPDPHGCWHVASSHTREGRPGSCPSRPETTRESDSHGHDRA